MRKVFIGKSGKAILIPFLPYEKLINFKMISSDDKIKLENIINSSFNEKKLSSRRRLLQSWSDSLIDSSDQASRFLATQINILVSSPEIVRMELMDDTGRIKPDVEEMENNYLMHLKKYYSAADSPAVFSNNVQLYYKYLLKLEEPQFIDRDAFTESIKKSGEMLLNKKSNAKEIYHLFKKYCNKPFANLPMETFAINYIYQLYFEFTYEQRHQLTKQQYDDFCVAFGENLKSLSESLEKRNYDRCYNVLLNFEKIVNN